MRFSATHHLTLSMTLIAVSLVLIADLFGLVPDSRANALDARKQVAEALAVQMSIAATRSELDLIKRTLDVFVARNTSGVLSAAVRRANGEILSETREHAKYWMPLANDRSTFTHVLVPIFSGEERWGSVEVSFMPLHRGIFDWLKNSVWGLALFLAVIGLATFYAVLRRALRELDPRGTIPRHIKSAFDVLAEGVLILDDRGVIVLANAAFANKSGRAADSLIGINTARLEWRDVGMKRSTPRMLPWNSALATGEAKTRVLLRLARTDGDADAQTFVTNSAPILDGRGRARGAIVTFDDITALENKNQELKNTIDLLHESERALARLAARDPLTDCLNRRAFFDAFEPLCAAVENPGNQLSCLMLDIDFFKSINDRFGHDVGDKVIKWIAETVQSHVGADALVCRYGGEEFCVVLPNSGLFQAHGTAQQIRRAIEENAAVRFGRELSATVSIGLTSAQPGAKTTTAGLITQADKALYVAKASGRNRVVRWSADTDNVEAHPTARRSARTQEGGVASRETAGSPPATENMPDRSVPPVESDATPGVGLARFIKRIRQAVGANGPGNRRVGVLSIVPNQFRRISDTLGPAIADTLMNVVGQRLHATLCGFDVMGKAADDRSESLVSRLGTDELGVVLDGVGSRDDVDQVINAILRALSQPIEIDSRVVEIGVSIGVALTPEGGDTPEALLKNAAAARHYVQERNQSKRCEFYSTEMSVTSTRRALIVSESQRALDEGQLTLHYQPQLDLRTGQIAAWEALLRWPHPIFGSIEPSEIIPIAEQTGLIHGIGRWALRAACLQAKTWSDAGLGSPRMAVNLSAVQLQQSDVVAQVHEMLAQTGLAPERLELEVTESAIMHDQKLAERTLGQLKAAGIRIAIDDFGIGYSGLSYIKDFPVDVVKVDRSFLTNVLVDPRASKLYSAIIDMAQRLNLYVVAEGVEAWDVFDFLNLSGCDAVQGYLFSLPIDAAQATRVLRDGGNIGLRTRDPANAVSGTPRKSFNPSGR